MRDLEIVDAAELERFALLALSGGAAIAIRFAARHPARVSHLLTLGGFARGLLHRRARARASRTLDALCRLVEEGWGQDNPAFRQLFASQMFPGANAQQSRSFNELQRVACSPQEAASLQRHVADFDATADLHEDMPNDELNHVTQPGKQHFGFPYCHQGNFADPEFGWGNHCADYARPAALLGLHAAPLGMRFYTGKMFPAKYRGAMFIARHGSWNRTRKTASDIVVAWPDSKGGVSRLEPFLTGLIENNEHLGRLVDVLVIKDGSLLVSDDHNGAIYRISYAGK